MSEPDTPPWLPQDGSYLTSEFYDWYYYATDALESAVVDSEDCLWLYNRLQRLKYEFRCWQDGVLPD